eukprot:gene7744-7198_t
MDLDPATKGGAGAAPSVRVDDAVVQSLMLTWQECSDRGLTHSAQ